MTKNDRVCLNTIGALKDIEKYVQLLTPGMKVILYEDEFELEASLELDDGEWLGKPDMSTIKYY